MKPVAIVLSFLLLGALLQISCGGTTPNNPNPGPTRTSTSTRTITLTPTITTTPTRTATPLPIGVTFSVNGFSYSTTGPSGSAISSVTISNGNSAVWDSTVTGSNHTLLISGANLTTCSQTYPNGNGAITLNLGVGTYQFHCSVHGSCSTGGCGNCSSMAATLVVQ